MIIKKYLNHTPKIHETAYIAEGVVIIGDVEIGAFSNIWFGVVIRGDVAPIRIGKNTNVQDGTVIHVNRNDGPTIIGDNVTIGHKALLHACIVEDNSFVGMSSTVLDFAKISTNSMLGAGAVLTPKKTIPKNELWVGSPAKFHRNLSQEEIDYMQISADNYVKLSREYL